MTRRRIALRKWWRARLTATEIKKLRKEESARKLASVPDRAYEHFLHEIFGCALVAQKTKREASDVDVMRVVQLAERAEVALTHASENARLRRRRFGAHDPEG